MMLVMRLTLNGADPNFVKDKEATPLSSIEKCESVPCLLLIAEIYIMKAEVSRQIAG